MKKIVILLLILFLLSGCEQYYTENEGSKDYIPINPLPDEDTEEVVLYFPHIKNNYLVPEKRIIERENIDIEEKIIRELFKGTRRKNLKDIIPKGTELLSIEVIEGVAYVSFSKELISGNKDEVDEALLLYSIVNTLTERNEISKVQILIEANIRKKLYTHYSIADPLEGSKLIVKNEYISPLDVVIDYYESLKVKNHTHIFELMNYTEDKQINYNTLLSYLESSYGEMTNYEIRKYNIVGYGRNIKISAYVTIITHEGMQEKSETIDFNLIFKNSEFKIQEIL